MPKKPKTVTFPDVDFDSLARELTVQRTSRDNFYLSSYPYICNHVQRLQFDGTHIDRQNTSVALILISSWMGRGTFGDLPALLGAYESTGEIVTEPNRVYALTAADLTQLLPFCNDKVVATSKFLHFREPSHFAIWDRRVAAALNITPHYVENVDTYLAYNRWLQKAHISDCSVRSVCQNLGIPEAQGRLRAKEFLLFSKGER